MKISKKILFSLIVTFSMGPETLLAFKLDSDTFMCSTGPGEFLSVYSASSNTVPHNSFNDYETFCALVDLAKILLYLVNQQLPIELEIGRPHMFINCRFHQTTQGLILVKEKNRLCTVWTPWGKCLLLRTPYNIDWDKINIQLLDYLNNPPICKERFQTDSGAIMGPLYIVNSIENYNLPKAQLKDKSHFLSIQEAKERLKQLNKEYIRHNSVKPLEKARL